MFTRTFFRSEQIKSGRIIFHHNKGPSAAPTGDDAFPTAAPTTDEAPGREPEVTPAMPPQRIDAVEQGRSDAILNTSVDKIKPKEANEAKERPYSHVMPFANNTEKIVSSDHLKDFFVSKPGEVPIGQIWRLLDIPRRMEYSLIRPMSGLTREELQIKFLRDHRSEIQRNYGRQKDSYKERPAIQKVPVVAVPATLPNRATLDTQGKRVIMMGENLSLAMSRDKDFQEANAKHMEGTDNPLSALEALKKMDSNDLQGAILTLNFGTQMFFEMDLEAIKSATDDLLKLAQSKEMKVVVGTPLHARIYIGSTHCVYGGDEERAKKAQEAIDEYKNHLAERYQQGMGISAIVGIGVGMTRSHLESYSANRRVDALNYFRSYSLDGGLTEEGATHCASAMINGINLALGNAPGQVATSASYEINNFGPGTAYDPKTKTLITDPDEAEKVLSRNEKTIELIPGYKKIQTIAKLESPLRDYLWSLGEFGSQISVGAIVDIGILNAVCGDADKEINALPEGDQKTFARKQFHLLRASVYYGRALNAAMFGENGKALNFLNEAVLNNSSFLGTVDTDVDARIFALRLQELRDDMNAGISYMGWEKRTPDGRLVDPEHRIIGNPRLHLDVRPERPKNIK